MIVFSVSPLKNERRMTQARAWNLLLFRPGMGRRRMDQSTGGNDPTEDSGYCLWALSGQPANYLPSLIGRDESLQIWETAVRSARLDRDKGIKGPLLG